VGSVFRFVVHWRLSSVDGLNSVEIRRSTLALADSATVQTQYTFDPFGNTTSTAASVSRSTASATSSSGCLSGRQQAGARSQTNLISLQVFGRHIVLWDFSRVNFSYIRVGCIFHAADYFGLEGLPLLDQFLDAL